MIFNQKEPWSGPEDHTCLAHDKFLAIVLQGFFKTEASLQKTQPSPQLHKQ